MATARLFILAALFLHRFEEFSAWSLREKDIKIDRVQQCPTDKYMPMVIEEFTVYIPEKKQYNVNATIKILEDIDSGSNIIFRMSVSRCSLSMLNCDEIETLDVPNVCERFAERGMIWSAVFDQMQPLWKCPLRKGTYRINDGKFDLTTIRRLPINPEKLNVNLTLYEYVTDVHKHRNVIKRQLICLESKVTITLSKTSSVTTHTSPSRRRNGARPP